ncbi:hypothetical protein AYI70_g11932 [Smittium culicis]|uniref:Uncharacterized protein n=1 Tax=Smittium culicis TaxID=133412 RepID=A0A1R1WZN8_9FUNG|nr:hypothetical protein AYI70_g11932 [Smittium culicis]
MTPRSQLESKINCQFPTNTSVGYAKDTQSHLPLYKFPDCPIYYQDYYAEDAVVLKNSAENLKTSLDAITVCLNTW